jgi:hypothetical protein
VVMGVLTCFDRRAVGANDGAGSARDDGDVVDLNVRFERLRTNAMPANIGRSAPCPKIATPSRFRLVGLFRSQSRNWTPPRVDAEEDDGVRDTSSSPVLLKKKKMRVLV